jgi:hypothetical protein
MPDRIAVYLEEYLSAHNERLRAHPHYRDDMHFSLGSPSGALVQHTRDRELLDADAGVFDEVRQQVASTHRLLLP